MDTVEEYRQILDRARTTTDRERPGRRLALLRGLSDACGWWLGALMDRDGSPTPEELHAILDDLERRFLSELRELAS